MAPIPMWGTVFCAVLLIGISIGLYLLLRIACKVSILTSACLVVFLITPIWLMLVLRVLIRHSLGTPSWFVSLLLPAIAGVILIVQFLRWAAGGGQGAGGVVTSEERQKTLKMVNEGKITSQEASELLEALGRSSAMRGQDAFSRMDMMTLAGIGLVVLGFFLPWVRIHIEIPGWLGTSGYQAGYHAGAVGWAVLVISMLAALPVFITPKEYLYKLSLLQMFLFVLGAAITISLIVQANRLGAGLFFCLAGFVIAAMASFLKFKKLAA